MRRAIAFLGLAVLAAGCGDTDTPIAQSQTPGKPAADEARACIAAYLGQCGWKDVELTALADAPEMPKGAGEAGEAWAYTFSAHYTNVFGERQTSENWVAVVARNDGQPSVTSCFDQSRRMVGGHHGDEKTDIAVLAPTPPADDLPAIVPPKP